MKIEDTRQTCEEISNLANKELLLEEMLDGMRKEWESITVTHLKNPTTLSLNNVIKYIQI